MIGTNAGEILIQKLNQEGIEIEHIQNILDHQTKQSIKRRLDNFVNKKGWLHTFLEYCNALNFKVNFIITKNDREYKSDNLGELLEKVREELGLTRYVFAEKKLNLAKYNYTYDKFKRNRCSFEKLYEVFEDKLGFELEFEIK